MDDLKKAILILFDVSGSTDDRLKKKAKDYCNEIKEKSSICSICLKKLCFSSIVEVQFWCLQTLQDVIRIRYASMSLEEKFFVRKSVFSMACLEPIDDENVAGVLEGPAYIKKKLAQVLVTLIYFEYLLIWSSIFTDILPHLSKGAVVIDMFCWVLSRGRRKAKGKRNSLRRRRPGHAI